MERGAAQYIGVRATDLPAIFILDGERGLKFKYSGDVRKVTEK